MNLPRLIGVIQLPSLAGVSKEQQGRYPAEVLQAAGLQAVREAQLLAKLGYDGIILVNWGDRPFFEGRVPPETIACMAIIAAAVRESVRIQVGIRILRNDARAALAISAVTGCDFICVNAGKNRVEALSLQTDAAFLVRERARLQAPVALLTELNLNLRGSTPVDWHSVLIEASFQGQADGLIMTLKKPGGEGDLLPSLQAASRVAQGQNIPLYLGEEVDRDLLLGAKRWVRGVIAGTVLRKGQQPGAPLDEKNAREFAREFSKSNRRSSSGRPRKGNVQKK